MTRPLSPAESLRIDALRFPLIVLVIYIHARTNTVSYGDRVVTIDGPLVGVVRSAMSDGVARAAVPLFFMIAGYLLFYGFERWSWAAFREKARRRVHTLLVPYLFWNLTLLALIVVALHVPGLRTLFGTNNAIAHGGWQQYAGAIVGLPRYPVAYQFWFIRDLMVLVVTAPAWFVLARGRVTSPLTLLVLSPLWLFEVWPVDIPAIEALLFFFLGLSLGVRSRALLPSLPLRWTATAYGAFLAGFLLMRGRAYEAPVQHAAVVMGVVFFLVLAGKLPEHAVRGLAALAGTSFFVFAVHEPLTTAALKILYRVLPLSPLVALVVYLIVPIVVILVALAAFRIASALLPRFTGIVTGR